MVNVDTSGGSIRKMKGYSKVTASPITGDVTHIYYDEFTGNIYASYGIQLGKLVGSTLTQLTGATGFTNNIPFSFCRVGDYLMCVNGVDVAKTWNEGTSTLANITTPPATWTGTHQPRANYTWNRRAFAWGVDNQVDLLFYSKLDDVNTWTAGVAADSAGAIRIGNDGKPIKAVIACANGLLIFKDPGLYILTGSNNTTGQFDQTSFDWQLISSSVDAVGYRAVVSTIDTVFAWGRAGVWQLQGTQVSQKISVDMVSKFIAYDVYNVTTKQDDVCAVHYAERNQIWFGVSNAGGSTIDTVHCYDYANIWKEASTDQIVNTVGQWFLRSGYSHRCMARVRDSFGRGQIYSGGYSTNGYIYQQNNTTDFDGSAMSVAYYTNWQPFAGVPRGRTPIVILSLGPQTTTPVTYNYAYDFSPTPYGNSVYLSPTTYSSVWHSAGGTGSGYWGTAGSSGVGTYQTGFGTTINQWIFGVGRRIQHRFSQNTVGADFAILEVMHPSLTVGNR
jgi:imidazole glycerol phosphate synthase subunit HisF